MTHTFRLMSPARILLGLSVLWVSSQAVLVSAESVVATEMDVLPIEQMDSNTMVDVRPLGKDGHRFAFSVDETGPFRKVVLSGPGRIVELTEQSPFAVVEGKTLPLETAQTKDGAILPQWSTGMVIEEGRVYVPSAFVKEVFELAELNGSLVYEKERIQLAEAEVEPEPVPEPDTKTDGVTSDRPYAEEVVEEPKASEPEQKEEAQDVEQKQEIATVPVSEEATVETVEIEEDIEKEDEKEVPIPTEKNESPEEKPEEKQEAPEEKQEESESNKEVAVVISAIQTLHPSLVVQVKDGTPVISLSKEIADVVMLRTEVEKRLVASEVGYAVKEEAGHWLITLLESR